MGHRTMAAFEFAQWGGCSSTDEELFAKIAAGQLFFPSPSWDSISNLAKVIHDTFCLLLFFFFTDHFSGPVRAVDLVCM